MSRSIVRRAVLRGWLLGGVVLAGSVVAAGCAGGDSGAAVAPSPAWTEVQLAGGPTSVVLGDLRRCADRWYAAGASRRPVEHPDLAAGEPAQATAPALWTGPDGWDWQPVPLAPVSYYGARQVLVGLACAGTGAGAGSASGSLSGGSGSGPVALGSKPGGAHGNPRMSSWRPDGHGGLAEVDGPVELYGGPRAITVNAVAGGPGGWLIAGNRVGADGGPTAAVWLSPDAGVFTEHSAAAGLASTPDTVTTARGTATTGGAATTDRGAATGPAGWLVFGDSRPTNSISRAPALWISADGLTWRSDPPPVAAGVDGSVSAVDVDGDRVLAMGTLGGTPHAWYRDPAGWRDAGSIPADGGPAPGVARVGQIALTPSGAYATVDGGDHWSLWRSADLRSWQRVPVPVQPPSGAQSRLLVAVSGDRLVVGESDAVAAHLWVADRPG